MKTNDYTLPRGEIHFARFKPGTETPDGFDYIGNTPEFAFTIETEDLEHYSSDRGLKELDDSIALEVNRTGNMVTDNISPENLGLFLYGTAVTVAQAAVPGETETLEGVVPGRRYTLGVSASNPVGYKGVDAGTLVITDSTNTTTYVAGTDYRYDAEVDFLEILEDGNIASGDDINLTYDVKSSTRDRVIAGDTVIEGALKYVAYPAKGGKKDYYFPRVQFSPNGDFNLKGDEWQTIPLNVKILKATDVDSAIYMDGRPVFA